MNESKTSPAADQVIPPRPERRVTTRVHHGDVVEDPYAWLRDEDDPEVLDILRQENAYTQERTRHTSALAETLFGEIKARTRETDLSVPVRYRGWWYYSRTTEGEQYPRQCRVPVQGRVRPDVAGDVPPAGEQVLLDGNVEAGGGEFFALGALDVDHAGARVAFAVDRTGDERFDVVVRDVESGEPVDTALTGVGYGLVWSADDRYLFYTRLDDAWRPHEVWRHEVGTDCDADVRVFVEEDETFWMGIEESRDERWLVLTTAARSSSEVHLLDLHDPTGELRCVRRRTPGLEYDVEPAGDRLLVVHNADRVDFSVGCVSVAAFRREVDPAWEPWWTPAEGRRVLGVEAFERFVVATVRSDGLPTLLILEDTVAGPPQVREVPTFAALGATFTGENPEWDSTRLQIVQESFLVPRRVCEFDPETGAVVVLKQREVLGGYDASRFVEERVWVRAQDGTPVPMSVVRRADVPADGTAPGLLHGYGAYEISTDPSFSVASLSLLERGLVLAFAHVRGGGEMGRSWWLQGRLEHKVNSFTDLVDCARYLVSTGTVAPGRLGLEGGSAGGLLVGAAVNLAPDLFRVVHAAVPFVDALTTILDPTLPLTVGEWEEWGNPLEDPEIYAVMKSYSPYENITPVPYPAVLATSGLNDTRVQVGEPLKWVSRLRETVTSDARERPVLMRTEMVAGHGGRSGRYDAWRQSAFEMAFLLDQLGVNA